MVKENRTPGGGGSNDSPERSVPSFLRQAGQWCRRHPFGSYLIILAVIAILATIVAFTSVYGGFRVGFWAIVLTCGGVVGALVGLFFSGMAKSDQEENPDRIVWGAALTVIVLALVVGMFPFYVPESSYAVWHQGSSATLLASGEYWRVPYSGWLVPISSYSHAFTAGIEVDGSRVVWDFQANLTVTDNYEEAFKVLTRVGDGRSWRQQAQQTFERGVNDYLANSQQVEDLPRQFEFELPEKYQNRLAKLGYTASSVKARNIQFVRSSK